MSRSRDSCQKSSFLTFFYLKSLTPSLKIPTYKRSCNVSKCVDDSTDTKKIIFTFTLVVFVVVALVVVVSAVVVFVIFVFVLVVFVVLFFDMEPIPN